MTTIYTTSAFNPGFYQLLAVAADNLNQAQAAFDHYLASPENQRTEEYEHDNRLNRTATRDDVRYGYTEVQQYTFTTTEYDSDGDWYDDDGDMPARSVEPYIETLIAEPSVVVMAESGGNG